LQSIGAIVNKRIATLQQELSRLRNQNDSLSSTVLQSESELQALRQDASAHLEMHCVMRATAYLVRFGRELGERTLRTASSDHTEFMPKSSESAQGLRHILGKWHSDIR